MFWNWFVSTFNWKIGGKLWPRLKGATQWRPTGAQPSHKGSCPSIFANAWLGLHDELSISTVEHTRDASLAYWYIMDSEVMLIFPTLHVHFKLLLMCHVEFQFSLSPSIYIIYGTSIGVYGVVSKASYWFLVFCTVLECGALVQQLSCYLLFLYSFEVVYLDY